MMPDKDLLAKITRPEDEEEERRTQACLEDLRQYLSRADGQCKTRLGLVYVLEERMSVISDDMIQYPPPSPPEGTFAERLRRIAGLPSHENRKARSK